jgi:hypothetical protein
VKYGADTIMDCDVLFDIISNLYGYGKQDALAAGNSNSLAQNTSIIITNMATRCSEAAPVLRNNKALNGKRSLSMKNNCLNKIVRCITRR